MLMATMGPNVKKLLIHKMSCDLVPSGGGMAGAIASLVKPGNLSVVAKKAMEWVSAAVAVVKTTPDNPYGDDDEAIAGEILRQIDEKKKLRSGGNT
jgi:hypothetical protein